MKKLNKNGFTLIELLAVIVIMGILMLVAIPAVSRTIENSRRSTFANTAQTYINAVKTSVSADEFTYDGGKQISSAPTGYYYYSFNSADNTGKDLMEQGGKSSWSNTDVKGYVLVRKLVTAATATRNETQRYEYAIVMIDSAKRGIDVLTKESAINKSVVKPGGTRNQITAPVANIKDSYKEDDTDVTYKVKSAGAAGTGEVLALPLTLMS